MNAQMNIRILSSHMIPSFVRGNLQYNDPKHTRVVLLKSTLRERGIKDLDWPSQSSGLNPIESLWL